MGMTAYIAGKWQQKDDPESDLVAVENLLEEMSIERTMDWSDIDEPRSEEAAEDMRAAIMSADVLILVYAENLLGGLLETGMAMGEEKPVLVYKPHRESTFWKLPEVYSFVKLEHMREVLEREEVFAEAPYDDPIRPNDVKMPARMLRAGDEPHVTVMGGDEYFSIVNVDRPNGGRIYLTMNSWGGDITDNLDPNKLIEIRGRK